MDNFVNEMEGGQKPRTLVEEAYHREQERKKYDIIRIKNPTNKDFWVKYDINQYQRVPANSEIDVPRYIATRYLTHMKDKLIHDKAQQMHDAQLADRDKKGLPRYADKYTENKETYETNPYPKSDDPTLIAQHFSDLWLGTVYEFGKDKMPENQDPRAGEVDITPVEQKVIDSLRNKRVAPDASPMGQFQPRPSAPPIPTQPPINQPTGFADLSQKLDPSEVTA